MAMTDNKQQIIAEFDKCPACGSTRRFAESVAAEQKEKGLMGQDLPVGVWEFAGPLFDPRMINKMLVGSKVPTIRVTIDACLDCGTIYAVRVERGEVPLRAVVAQPPKGQQPGFMPPGIAR
jgi:hypothetical protein